MIQQGTYDIWQVFGLCDQIYQGLSIDWDAANPMRNGDWGQIIPPKKGRAVARRSKNPKHPAVKREEEDWGKKNGDDGSRRRAGAYPETCRSKPAFRRLER